MLLFVQKGLISKIKNMKKETLKILFVGATVSFLLGCCGSSQVKEEALTAVDAPGEILLRSDGAKLEIPLAPKEYRRPDGWKPQRYAMTLEEISKKYSADTMKRAADLRKRVDDVNNKGKWKPTAQSIDQHKCPEWFQDAKFGIFVDWGLWSIASWTPKKDKGAMYPDWYEHRMYSNYDPKSWFYGYKNYHIMNWGKDFERDDFIPLFKAKKFDADKLVEIFKDSGAKYVVPFLKHHSGFSLWDCSYTFRDSVDRGPKRDIAKEFLDACKKEDMKFGFYFSLDEWEAPYLKEDGSLATYTYGVKYHDKFDSAIETKASGKIAVKDFISDYIVPQAIEFIDKYNPDIVWYDADWFAPASKFRSYDISAYFYNKNEGKKDVAVNDRYGLMSEEEEKKITFKGRKRKWLRTVRGDFYTDEFGDTSSELSMDNYHPWEACRGISQSYGNNWQDNETNVISAKEFVNMFADMVARGGNLLLIVNLDGQGGLPEIQKQRLLDIGGWLKVNGEAIYATRPFAPYHCDGASYTMAKDGSKAFAILKNPAKTVTLAYTPKAGTKIVSIIGNKEIKWQYKDATKKTGAVLTLPDDLAKSQMPVALKFNLK